METVQLLYRRTICFGQRLKMSLASNQNNENSDLSSSATVSPHVIADGFLQLQTKSQSKQQKFCFICFCFSSPHRLSD